MKNASVQSFGSIGIILAIAAAVVWAGSGGSQWIGGWPLFGLCALVAFGLNWVVFVPSYLGQTEHYFDLTGSITYLVLLAFALLGSAEIDARSLLLAFLVGCWAVRLGSFLFRRVREDGSDGRFDNLKPHFARFLMTWTLQGLWVFLTLSCVLAAMTSAVRVPLGGYAAVGVFLFVTGLALEIAADRQKRVFRKDPANRDRFIATGLWAWSRHPNYVGEIMLWTGLAIASLPVLAGGQYVTLISPVFVFVLLTRISGIPLLEARGRKKWGDDPAYRAYLARTPVLFPLGGTRPSD